MPVIGIYTDPNGVPTYLDVWKNELYGDVATILLRYGIDLRPAVTWIAAMVDEEVDFYRALDGEELLNYVLDAFVD